MTLRNDAEREVVQALCDRLTDSWIVLPSVGMAGDRRDYEIDVVITERNGIAVIEVKPHRPHVRDGARSRAGIAWSRNRSTKLGTMPTSFVGGFGVSTRRSRWINVEYAVAFPNVADVRGALSRPMFIGPRS